MGDKNTQEKRRRRENFIRGFVKINFEGPIEDQFDDPPHFIPMKFGDPPTIMLDPPTLVNDMSLVFYYHVQGVS